MSSSIIRFGFDNTKPPDKRKVAKAYTGIVDVFQPDTPQKQISKTKVQDYFDAIYTGDTEMFLQLTTKFSGKTEPRKISTYGFSALFCAIIYSRTEIAVHLLNELQILAPRKFKAIIHQKEIVIPKGSNALHLAILLDRCDLVMKILKHLSSSENELTWDQMGKPNELGFTSLYYFASSENPAMQIIPVSLYYIFTTYELTCQPLNGILRCITQNQSVLLGHVLHLCERISYYQTIHTFLSSIAQFVYQNLNNMLLDTSINQEHLAQTRDMIVKFFDGIIPTREFVLQSLRQDFPDRPTSDSQMWKTIKTELRVQIDNVSKEEDSSLSGEQIMKTPRDRDEPTEENDSPIPHIVTAPLSTLSESDSQSPPQSFCSSK